MRMRVEKNHGKKYSIMGLRTCGSVNCETWASHLATQNVQFPTLREAGLEIPTLLVLGSVFSLLPNFGPNCLTFLLSNLYYINIQISQE